MSSPNTDPELDPFVNLVKPYAVLHGCTTAYRVIQ
jgi:hypothetical protein